MKESVLLGNKMFLFEQKVIWNWHHQNSRIFQSRHICYVWWVSFSTDSQHFFKYNNEADFMQGFWTKTTIWKWYCSTNEIVYVLLICGNIPAPPAYVVYLSQLIQYFRAAFGFADNNKVNKHRVSSGRHH